MSTTPESAITRDVRTLRASFPHRAPNTENEREAASFLYRRLREHTNDVTIEPFESLNTNLLLYASYYAEFTVVSLLAVWWPRAAFIYGCIVMLLYLGEFTGFRILGRLLPLYESQNVTARFMGGKADRLCVIAAHYDTPKVHPLSQLSVSGWQRPLQYLIVACMAGILATCLSDALGVLTEAPWPVSDLLRWSFLGVLLGCAGMFIYCDFEADYGPVGKANAGGAAMLLHLARKLSEGAVLDADVMLVATGSKEGGLNGMRELLTKHRFDRSLTNIIVLEQPESGPLQYLKGEGMLATYRAPKAMREAAERAGIGPWPGGMWRGWPTESLVAHARGLPAITLWGGPPQPAGGEAASRQGPLTAEEEARIEDAAERVLRFVRTL